MGFAIMRSSVFAAVVVAASAALFVQPALANVITINGGAGTVTCTPNCQAYTGAGTPGAPTGLGVLSNSAADEYVGVPSNAVNEAARLNTIAGTFFTGTGAAFNGQQFAGSGGSGANPDDTFMTLALYIVMKIGNDDIFIKNTSGGQLQIQYDSFAGQGSGLSHYSEFGDVVPLPGALWLMGAGLAGLGFASRKKKA